ncbi:hypothetical protein [Streptomyces sp. NPDC058867]|uniref:hypothetical protein n=1 Tax=unclassified Streptomyces TaxID=2593676 RepID=UPI003676DAF0
MPINSPASPRPAAVAAVVVAALLTACSGGADSPGSSSGERDDGAATTVTQAGLSRSLPDDPVRMVLPTTGAETRWTQGLDVFVQQVARSAAVSCASERGVALPEAVPPAFIRFSELPDLDFIARHGTSASAPVPTPAAGPTPTRTATPAVQRRCASEGKAAADALRDLYAPLQQEWFGELVSLRRDPAATRALDALPDCLAEYGIEVPDEDGFFSVADTHMQTAAPADLPREERVLGQAYAACMRPVEAVREPARTRLLSRFRTTHAEELRALRGALLPALRKASAEHGVSLVFPAP